MFRPATFFALAALFSLASADCASETAALESNPTLMSLYKEAYNGTLALVDPVTCGNQGCTYDFSTASANLEEACTTAGGQYVIVTQTYFCDVNGATGTEFILESLPACVGASCDVAQADATLQQVADEFASMLDNIDGVSKCSVEVTTAAANSVGASFLLLVGAGSAFLASTVMLL